jgi:hypothetical protein
MSGLTKRGFFYMAFLVQKTLRFVKPHIDSLQNHAQLGLKDHPSQPFQVNQVKPTPQPHASSHH